MELAEVQVNAARPSSLAGVRNPFQKWRKLKEKIIELCLLTSAMTSVVVVFTILWILVSESIPFFQHVRLIDFLTDTEWTPLFEQAHYGILPLLCGTFLTTLIALSVAIPCGTMMALFLSEYATPFWRETLKPVLELLAAVPTVVYGYFALMTVTPLLQKLIPSLPGFNVLSAGIVMGVMIVPYVSSLTEDALRSVPNYLREGSMAMGASKAQTALRVLYPAAFSGISSAYILAISRALGETMVVSIAAGLKPNLTLNPLEPAATVTAFIVQVSQGDLPHGSIGFQSIYVAGLALLILTLVFNLFGFYLRRRFKETYD